MSRIVVLGDESFTLGFELIGIESFLVSELERLLDKVEDVGIIIISEEDHDGLTTKLKSQINKSVKPIVVILSEEDLKGNSLRELVIRALGVDVLK